MMRSILSGLLFFLLQIKVSSQELSLEPVTAKNAMKFEQVERLGRGTANALDWRPDGKILAVASSTGVWLLDENLQIFKQTPIVRNISDLAWSSDGHHLAVASNIPSMCSVQVWNSDVSEREFNTDFCGGEVLWSSDAKYLAVFNRNPDTNEMQLINIEEKQSTLLPGQDGIWSPHNDTLFTRLTYTRSFNGVPTLYTWDASTGKQLFALELSHSGEDFGSLLWGIDEHELVISCDESNEQTSQLSVNLCELNTRTGAMNTIERINTVFEGECACMSGFDWNTDEKRLAYVNKVWTRGFLDQLFVFDKATNKTIYIGNGELFDWKVNSSLLTTIVGNGEIRTYDTSTDTTISQSKLFTSPINMISIRPNSQDIASSSFGYEQDILIWNLAESMFEPRLSFHVEPAEIVYYIPDGNELIAGGRIDTDIVVNQNIDSFDPDTGSDIRDVEAFYDQGASPPRRYWNANFTKFIEVNEEGIPVLSYGIRLDVHNRLEYVSWSPDEKTIATVEADPDDYPFKIHTWDASNGQLINTYVSGTFFRFEGLVWSPNSRQIAVILEHPTGSGNYGRGLRIFSVVKDKTYDYDQNDFEVFENVNIDMYDGPQTQVVWNNDGTLLAVALSTNIQIHHLKDDKPLATLPAYRITSLQWSKDDRFIAGGSEDGTITIWGVSP
jgi:WD40 repeat protein